MTAEHAAGVGGEVEALRGELLRADADADVLRDVVFRMAEDLTRIKVVCTQEHPPKMGSPTRDWPVGTETRHGDGSRCVLLNDGDYALTTTRATAADTVLAAARRLCCGDNPAPHHAATDAHSQRMAFAEELARAVRGS